MVPPRLRAAFLAAAVLFVGSQSSAPASAPALHAIPDRSCKPSPPLIVELKAREPSGGPQVTLDVLVRPVLAMQALSWELQLGDGLTLVQGPAQGEAAPARGEQTAATLRLALPADGRSTLARLVVTGHFTGHGDDGETSEETVQDERTLSWGPAAAGPTFSGLDPETGEQASFVAVPAARTPAAHRTGK
jgi:hypothetical protein